MRRATDRADAIVIAPLGLGASEDRPSSWTFPGSATGIDGHGAATCDPSVITDETYPSCGPVGTGTAQNICSWTQCQSDDMGFVTALLDHAEATLCIDTDQVFAAGASNGGMFVWSIGQNATLAPRFRALASLIGLPHRGYLDVPANAPPILSLTARDDTTVPPGAWDDPSPTISSDGTLYHYTGATAITQRWAEAHQCDTSAPAQSIDAPFDCRSHCPTTGMFPPVLDCRMEGGHDAAPGTPGALCLISSPTSDVPLPT